MKRARTLTALAAAFVLTVSAPAFAIPFTFSVLPAGGSVDGPAGSTVGWGYEITNTSATDWLELTNLVSDAFVDGTPTSLFDFPILAPLASISVPFDFIAGSGLYQLTWDPGASPGFVNNGVFVVEGQFYDDDPLAGGSPTSAADPQSAPYSATVTGSVVPEPAAVLLLGGGALAWLRSRGRRLRSRE